MPFITGRGAGQRLDLLFQGISGKISKRNAEGIENELGNNRCVKNRATQLYLTCNIWVTTFLTDTTQRLEDIAVEAGHIHVTKI